MGLVQSAENGEIIFQVLGNAFLGHDDIRPIDECACYNEDGSFIDTQFEAYLYRESDERSAKMKVVFLMMQVITEAKDRTAIEIRDELQLEPPRKKTRVHQTKTMFEPSSGVDVHPKS